MKSTARKPASWPIAFATMLMLMLASAASFAQETSFRSGVVTDITPIQVPAQAQPQQQNNRTTGALGRMLGRAAGRAVSRVTGDYSYDAYQVANATTQDVVADVAAGATASGGQTETAYMVLVKFDDGQESAIQIPNASHLSKGGRVRVFGSGRSIQIVPAS